MKLKVQSFPVFCLMSSMLVFNASSAVAQEAEYAASAFTQCPAKAFLTQGKVPMTLAINLVTGDYSQITLDHGTNKPLNGVGFNPNDRFIYGWSYEHGQPARVHNDWKIEPLLGVNITENDYYVGDVSSRDNKYFVYRNGSTGGLYSIGLDPAAADFEKMQKVTDGQSLYLRIADFAFHPDDGYAYAVESDGDLHRIDVVDGTGELLANIGQTGTFGAAYFDAEGNLYIGRNNDGSIFRIAIDSGEYTPVLFAVGPAASTNDGSRCATAPLVDVSDTSIDFGDAPDSYGTSLAENGARHGLVNNPELFLGSRVDGESDGTVFPLSDDDNDQLNDEDGIQLVTSIEGGHQAIVMVTASASGYLNGWIDYDRDGEFDDSDHAIVDYPVTAGEQMVYVEVPDGLNPGSTWSRFRLSSAVGLAATGGVADGEVEDYEVTLVKNRVTVFTYPSESGWSTVAFEDNWPFVGDYDMNDLVVHLRTMTHKNPDGVIHVEVDGQVAAVGASYHNGFAIRLPGVKRADINESETTLTINHSLVTSRATLEPNREEAIFIISEDVFDYVSSGEHCDYYRTEVGCGSAVQMVFNLSVSFNEVVDVPLSGVYDPFLFASPGKWHGPHFVDNPGRSYEIHLKNYPPTEAFNQELFGQIGQDASSQADGYYFLTNTGMPWALEIGNYWQYPIEFVDLSKAYPLFKNFAQSNGASDVYWYSSESAEKSLLFKD